MLDDFTVNTNIVKLRDDIWSAMTVTVGADFDAGDFCQPFATSAICGVMTADTLTDADGTIVYKANKIVVPCALDADTQAGTAVAIDAVNLTVVNLTSGDATAMCGILTKDATTYDSECEIDLLGFLLPISILT